MSSARSPTGGIRTIVAQVMGAYMVSFLLPYIMIFINKIQQDIRNLEKERHDIEVMARDYRKLTHAEYLVWQKDQDKALVESYRRHVLP